MGAITAFSISVAIILAVEYFVYKCMLSSATFYRFNRVVLLSCYAVALVAAPLSDIIGKVFAASASPGDALVGLPAAGGVAPGQSDSAGYSVIHILPLVYLAGVIVMAIITLFSYLKMANIIRRGKKRRFGRATLVIVPTPVSPFSWCNYLILSPDDASNPLIIEHEMIHIRNRHSFDLMFAQLFVIFNWFNPVAYLMRRELSAVHEYEVDRQILCSGIRPSEYQMLLIRKTVGPGFQSIANSLNHSQLKNRLTMMLKSNSKRVRYLCAAALLPAAIMAVAVTNLPAVASTLSNVASVNYGKVSENLPAEQPPVSDDNQVYEQAEQMPHYPGGERAMMLALMGEVKYPPSLIEEGVEGLAIVRFVVSAEGYVRDISVLKSSGNEILDAEAVRAVKAALNQKWTPGMVDGKPVNVWYVLPVRFATKK